jgi:hypothetical protein
LESANFLGDDIPTEVAVVAAFLEEAAAPADAQDVAAQPMVSLYAIAGIQTENAMHLPVSIHGHRLVALLDSGSTHNFIDADLMRHLRLSIAPHPTMRILVVNGDRVPCEGVAHDVALAIGTKEFSISCFDINLGDFDVILGVDFLRTLGPILWDFEDLCMAFTQGYRRILWKGLSSPCDDIREPAVRALAAAPDQPLLDRLLRQFNDVFTKPCGLPPACPYGHHIHLLPGTAPVAVWPYRYLQL